jgi:hypothetical protein
MSQSAQYRIRDADFSDWIIARWQRSKEFCNKIPPTPDILRHRSERSKRATAPKSLRDSPLRG